MRAALQGGVALQEGERLDQVDLKRQKTTKLLPATFHAAGRPLIVSVCVCVCLPHHSFVGMDWARYIVALGALMGIVTTTLVRVLCRGGCFSNTSGVAAGQVYAAAGTAAP